MFGFERLEVWQKAVEYAGTIDVTRAFPEEERFGLTSQLRRSSVSISSNIADQLQSFYRNRLRLNTRVRVRLRIAQKQKLVSNAAFEMTYKQAEELAKMLSGLRRTIKPRVQSKPLNPRLSTLNLD
jgi:23S rRNA-intervening sequence protein